MIILSLQNATRVSTPAIFANAVANIIIIVLEQMY